MARIIYNYGKLLGRIRELNLTQDQIAARINISPASMNLKLGNKSSFKQDEILDMCEALSIPFSDIPQYFFCH